MNNILEVNDLHVRYGSYEAVKGVSFALKQGGILGIVGESGSGKSTIAKVLMGLHREYSGKIVNSAMSMQMIFQDAVGSLNPRMTIGQTLREVLVVKKTCCSTLAVSDGGERQQAYDNKIGQQAYDNKARQQAYDNKIGQQAYDNKIGELLGYVGLSKAVLNQYPRELSGGQCQRVSIARALACKPDILVADEPVSALDVSVQARVLNLLRDLRNNLGLSILLIAHDLAVVKNVCDEICVMEHGLFVDRGESAAVFEHPTSDYTKKLLSAVPRIAI